MKYRRRICTQILFLQIGLSFEVNQEWHTVYRKNLRSLPKGQDVQVSQEKKLKWRPWHSKGHRFSEYLFYKRTAEWIYDSEASKFNF